MENKAYSIVKLIDNMHLKGENDIGLGADMDAKVTVGERAGATPMELLLQAMGGCSGMDVLNILRKRKLHIEQFEVKLEGSKQDIHPKMYRHINVLYRCKAKGLTQNILEKAVQLSLEKYCSVSIALKQTAEIDWKCEVIED